MLRPMHVSGQQYASNFFDTAWLDGHIRHDVHHGACDASHARKNVLKNFCTKMSGLVQLHACFSAVPPYALTDLPVKF